MKIIGEFKDEIKSNEIKIKYVPIEKIEIIKHQRKSSELHIKRMERSLKILGFVVPVVGIEKDDKVIIIDGQHRFIAAKNLCVNNLPVIILPDAVVKDMMELNVEKQLNLREKSYVALNIYREYLKTEIFEDDPSLFDSIEYAYFVTCGIAYEKEKCFYGSAFEPILKRIDTFIHEEIKNTFKIRECRAENLIELNKQMKEIANYYKEIGYWHPFIFRQMVSFANPMGKKRITEITFEEAIEKMIEKFSELKNKPELIKKIKIE